MKIQAKRKVYTDRTLSLDGKVYEVEAHLCGQTVLVRYDPLKPPGRPLQVFVNGQREKDATLVDAYQNCFVRRHRDDRARLETSGPSCAPASGLPLRALRSAEHDSAQEDR